MSHPQKPCQPSRFALIATVSLLWAPLATLRGADLDQTADSLKWIPADAAFYSVMLHTREQFEAVAHSRAWAKLRDLPAVQLLWRKAQEQLNQAGTQAFALRTLYEQPENRQLVELLGELFTQEVFCYAGDTSIGFVDLLLQVNNGVRFGPALMQLTGQAEGLPPNQMQAVAVLRVLSENLDQIRTPDVILGFKLTDTKRAQAQLKRLETLLAGLAEQTPQLKGRFKRGQVAGGDFLTLTLDGQMIPWQQIPFKQWETKPGEFDPLQKKLSELRLTVSLGLREGYLLVAVGETTAALSQLGQGPRLANRPEFKPLTRFADRRLTAISYVSKALNATVAPSKEGVEHWMALAKQLLTRVDLTPDQRNRLEKDIDRLGTDLKGLLSEPGAVLMFAFLTPRGQESYTYDWGEYRSADSSKPLPLLRHVGGSPLVAVVGRSRPSPETYALLVKWLRVGNQYVEELLVPRLEAAQREQYAAATKALFPLLRRLDGVTVKLLLPTLADGQVGFVLDAKLTSRQWVQLLPATLQPMPMLEPALIVAIDDPARLRQAMAEYRTIVNELITKVRELSGNVIPEFQIPLPQSRKIEDGILYFYPLPERLGLDPRLLPNAGLGEKVAVMTISPTHTERLLKPTTLKTDGGPLADLKRPLAAAVLVNFPAMVDALAPWVELGMSAIEPSLAQAAEGEKGLENLPQQARTVLEVLKVFRGYTSATYSEGRAFVTHGETVIRDLP